MEGMVGVEGSKCYLAMCKGVGFQMDDLVDVFVGTREGVRGSKTYPFKGRFKGVRIENGEERFLCRPIVGSQKGRCPSFPPDSCLKVKAFGSDVFGERKPLFFSKLKPEVQQRSLFPVLSPFHLRPTQPHVVLLPPQATLTPLYPTTVSCVMRIKRLWYVQRKRLIR